MSPRVLFSIRDQPQPPKPLVSTLGSSWRRTQALLLLNTNQQADASGQAPMLSMVLHSDVSLGVHPHRALPSSSCRKPLLDKMVSAGGPQWRGAQAQAQWLYKCGCRLLLLLVILIIPLPISLLVSILTKTYPLVTNPLSPRWSPPVVLSGAVLMISGSLRA